MAVKSVPVASSMESYQNHSAGGYEEEHSDIDRHKQEQKRHEEERAANRVWFKKAGRRKEAKLERIEEGSPGAEVKIKDAAVATISP